LLVVLLQATLHRAAVVALVVLEVQHAQAAQALQVLLRALLWSVQAVVVLVGAARQRQAAAQVVLRIQTQLALQEL
jgi:hypothetical protein